MLPDIGKLTNLVLFGALDRVFLEGLDDKEGQKCMQDDHRKDGSIHVGSGVTVGQQVWKMCSS